MDYPATTRVSGAVDPLDEQLKLSDCNREQACRPRPRHWGIILTLLSACTLPVLWLLLLAPAILGLIIVRRAKAKWTGRTLAEQRTLGLEALAALIVIPLTGTAATIGSGAAFYLFSHHGATSHRAAWELLISAGGLALVLPVEVVVLVYRHRTGIDPLPFEPDVDPRRGIDACRMGRTKRPRGFLPATVAFGIIRAEEKLMSDDSANAPTKATALRYVMAANRDICQLAALELAAGAWTVAAVVKGWEWWLMAIFVVASIFMLLLGAGVNSLSEFYERLRFGLRERALCASISRQDHDDEDRRALRSLAQSYVALLGEVRALRGDDLGGTAS